MSANNLDQRRATMTEKYKIGRWISGGVAVVCLLVVVVMFLMVPKSKEGTRYPGSAGAAERAVRAYLDKNERKCVIHQMYPAESLANALIRISFDSIGRGTMWFPFDRAPEVSPEANTVDRSKIKAANSYGLRVTYTSDEGFGRTSENDRVFVLDDRNVVYGYLLTKNIAMAKPGEAEKTGPAPEAWGELSHDLPNSKAKIPHAPTSIW
jgi:hypothetical protein